jgi:pseudouridine-5'-phosphate glycosidase/pseudouridine kinase
MEQEGLDTSGIHKYANGVRTAQYVAINDSKKDLMLAMADMEIFDGFESSKFVRTNGHVSQNVKWVVVDANWKATLAWQLMTKFSSQGAKIAFEPVSVAKSAAVFSSDKSNKHPLGIFPKNKINLTTPNHHELIAMNAAAKSSEYFETAEWWQVIDALGIPSSGARDRFTALTSRKLTDEGIPIQTVQLLPIIPTILTKLGADGVLVTELLKPDDPRLTDPVSAPYILSRCTNGSTEVGGVYMRLFPAVETVEEVVSVNGVGDTFLGVLMSGLARGLRLDESLINIAQEGAVMTLNSTESVSPNLSLLRPKLEELALLSG